MFSETIRIAARGARVHCEVLLEAQFLSGTMYLHNQAGILTSRDPDGAPEDIRWKGMQGLAAVSQLGASKIGASRQASISLNASNATLKSDFFESDQRAVKGRKFRFWGQFYDEDLQPIDGRFHIYTGIGDSLRMRKSGATSRELVLSMEDWLVRRRRSANSMVTHSDQQLRDPGSRGFIYVQAMLDQTLNLFDANV